MRIRRAIARLGWKISPWTHRSTVVPSDGVGVLIGAPHTSNWDFILMLGIAWDLGLKFKYLGKHTLFKPPFGFVTRSELDEMQAAGAVGEVAGEVGGERLAGAGYFSGALADALSRTGSFGADENRDGVITLTELRRRLLHSHGASTVRTYPEDSDFALFSYDLSAVSSRRRETSIEGITFSGDTRPQMWVLNRIELQPAH